MSMPSRSRRSSARKRLDVCDLLALDLVGQEAGARLADRAAAAGEPDALDDAVADPSWSVIRSPQRGLEPSNDAVGSSMTPKLWGRR